ncbi:beta-ketoacyl synthase N-terminal-like domain-containing protein [Actinokineospora guangxiensis]|uniref:Beta-ketoacyl synthase N-terminal-like domain-containing protein n=1 Tax=Actinokineospora guangxiensis TaxID=1490288 RepID=A0ABW0EK68_9PSEU
MGAVAGVGADPEEIYAELCAGRDARSPLRAFDPAKYRMRHAYEIDDRPGRDDRPLRATEWLCAAVEQAVAQAGLDDLTDVPVLVGTTLREQRSAELWWRDGVGFDPVDLDFGRALRTRFGITRTYTFANACAAGLYSLAMGTDLIELGLAETVIVAGADSITESAFGTLDRTQNETPEALLPFDEAHRGMVMGEGAAAMVVRRAGADPDRVLARVRGVSANCDAAHPTAPDAAGVTAVIEDAYRRAGVGPADIDLVMLHGSGTPLNDTTEASVLSALFADVADGPLLSAIKSMTGHTLGGSGLHSALVAVLAMRDGSVPPVRGLRNPIAEADGLRLVRDTAATTAVRTAQIDAFGFGGINAVAILEAAR